MSAVLRIPAERFDPPSDLELNAAAAQAWIDSLVGLRATEAGHQVVGALSAMNRSHLAFGDRLALLEVYRPGIERVIEALEAEFGMAGLPPTSAAQEALALCRDLAMEQGYGYKILIVEPPSVGRTDALPLLVYRAMGALAHLLRTAYLTYTGVPEGTWLELHRLYVIAEEARVPMLAVKGEGTIEERYIELLLVSLTDPYRLNPGEVNLVPEVVRAHPGLVRLSTNVITSLGVGEFVVECDFDRPPSQSIGDDTKPLNNSRRALSAGPLVERLRAQRDELRAAAPKGSSAEATRASAQIGLLHRLVVCWGDPPRRVEGREPTNMRVSVCVGLATLAHLVSLEGENAPENAASTTVEAGPLSSWQVLNRSFGGLRLMRSGGPLPQAPAVGEIVGVRFPERVRWTVGVVRWLKRLNDGATEFGLQFLGHAAISADFAPFSAETGALGSEVYRVLVLDGEASGAQPTVLCQPGIFQEMRPFQISSRGAAYKVRALSLIETGGAFELFKARR